MLKIYKCQILIKWSLLFLLIINEKISISVFDI